MSYTEPRILHYRVSTLTIHNPSHTLCKRHYTHSSTVDLCRGVIKISHAARTRARRHTPVSVSHKLLVTEARCVCFEWISSLSLPIPPSIPSSSDTALSWLRQLEAITLNQQLHRTTTPCAHSAYYLCQWPCVCECSKCPSMDLFPSLSLPDISSSPLLFFSPVHLSDCSSDQLE